MAYRLKLKCILLEDIPTSEDIFLIRIESTDVVDDLKKSICKATNVIKPFEMNLWMMKDPIPSSDHFDERIQSVLHEKLKNLATKLNPRARLFRLFPEQPSKEHVHIIVTRKVLPLPSEVAQKVGQAEFPPIICSDIDDISDRDLLWNKIRCIDLETEFKPQFAKAFHDVLYKKVAYKPDGTEFKLQIDLLKQLLGSEFGNHFIETETDEESLLTKHQLGSYINAASIDYMTTYCRPGSMTETCLTAVIVDPALRTFGRDFYRKTGNAKIPTRDLRGAEELWCPRSDFHVTLCSESNSYSVLLGESEADGETESDAMEKMALMSLHAWRVNGLYNDDDERIIFSVYVSQKDSTMYMFYKDPDAEDERFCMRCIFSKSFFMPKASDTVTFLRMLYNFVAIPRPEFPRVVKRKGMTALEGIAERLSSKRISSMETSGSESRKDRARGPSGADEAGLCEMGYAVQEELCWGNRNLSFLCVRDDDHNDWVAKWTSSRREFRIIQSLQSAESETYRNLVIPIENTSDRYIIMPWYADLTTRTSLSPAEYKSFRLQIIEAVAFLHEQGVVHRDIKPSNLLFDGDSLFIIDFGLAKYYREGDELSSGYCGTEDWTAPEVRDGVEWDPRSADVWAAAKVLQYLAKRSGVVDPLPIRIMSYPPSLRPTAAALFSEISALRLGRSKRVLEQSDEEGPSSKRPALEPVKS